MEERLGVDLFVRSTRQGTPTIAGSRILEQTKDILRVAEEIKDTATAFKEPSASPICLGIEPSIAPHLFGYISEKVHELDPDMKMICREQPKETLLKEMDHRVVDFAIMSEDEKAIDYKFTPVMREKMFLAVSKTHPLARKNRLSSTDVPVRELILLEGQNCERLQLNEETIGADVQIGSKVRNVLTALHLLTPDKGGVLVPQLNRQHVEAIHPDVRLLEIAASQFSRVIGVASRRACPKSAWLKALCDLMLANPMRGIETA